MEIDSVLAWNLTVLVAALTVGAVGTACTVWVRRQLRKQGRRSR